MKVIFLDFDGVLLTMRTRFGTNGRSFSDCLPDPLVCGLLQRVCKTGVLIVVSSTWRELGDHWKVKLDQGDLYEFIHPTDPCTPVFNSIGPQSRPREIADWLSRHPEVTDYQIIDDDPFEWTDEQSEKWIMCDPYEGMLSESMQALAQWAGLDTGKTSSWPQVTSSRPKLHPTADAAL